MGAVLVTIEALRGRTPSMAWPAWLCRLVGPVATSPRRNEVLMVRSRSPIHLVPVALLLLGWPLAARAPFAAAASLAARAPLAAAATVAARAPLAAAAPRQPVL